MPRIKRYALITLGSISLALGVIGIALPLLPTTPFILLTSYCFARSSEKLHRYLLKHALLGPIIESWQKNRSLSYETKRRICLFIWLSLTISAILVRTFLVSTLLFCLGIGLSIAILLIRTDKPTES